MLHQALKNIISLRKFSSLDLPFMKSLYSSSREEELAKTNFSLHEKNLFLSQQFNAQLTHYVNNYNTERFNIIEIDGQPIGRLFVDVWPNEIRIVDITLIPSHRKLGIGTHLLKTIFCEAQQMQYPVTIHVEQNNPAKNLYERLGFSVKSKANDIYLLMEWIPKR